MLVESQERRTLQNFYKMMKPTASLTNVKILEDQKLHFERLGNLILIHIDIAQSGSGSLRQYEAEWINGTRLGITEMFDYDRPSCPKMTDSAPFKDFKCFDYLEDTIMTTTRTTTTTPEDPITEAVPLQEIGLSN